MRFFHLQKNYWDPKTSVSRGKTSSALPSDQFMAKFEREGWFFLATQLQTTVAKNALHNSTYERSSKGVTGQKHPVRRCNKIWGHLSRFELFYFVVCQTPARAFIFFTVGRPLPLLSSPFVREMAQKERRRRVCFYLPSSFPLSPFPTEEVPSFLSHKDTIPYFSA